MTYSDLLNRFAGMKAFVLGDLMLDEYIFGRATRISPEAPVMVVKHHRTTRVPGGAANVARNIVALGGKACTIGVAGCDEAGDLLQECLSEEGLAGSYVVRDKGRSTTRKTRVLADHTHQVLRIDQEDDGAVGTEVEEELIARARLAVNECDVVVLSDYLKGVLTLKVSSAVIREAQMKGKPVVVNPKPRSLPNYRGANLISLNRAEASEALNRFRPISDEDALAAAAEIKRLIHADAVLVTLGESGMAASGDSDLYIEAPKVEVYDTAGAGDTVIATVALGLAAAGFSPVVFELAAQMAGSVVRHVGVATPSAVDLDNVRAR